MGLVPHHELVNSTAPFVTAFGTIFTHGAWAGKLVAALAVTSGIGALNGWTLVTTEVARAAADDGLFPRAFGWTDRKDTAWFGVVTAALLPSLLMLWAYTTKTGLTVFTELVALTVVTVAIPYLFSACAQLAYLVSKRRRVQGWALARDLVIAGAGVLFSMWVTFAAGYQSVYQALILVLAGVVVYAFLKAHREDTGQVPAPADRPLAIGRRPEMTFSVQSEVGQLRQVIVHRPGLELSRLTPRNVGELLFDDVLWAKKAKEEHDAFAEALREQGRAGPLLRAAPGRDPRAARRPGLRARPAVHAGDARAEPDRAAAPAVRRPRRPGAGRVPGRRRAQGRPAPGRGAQPEVGHAAGRRLRAAAAAEPPVPAGQLLLDLPGRVGQPDGQARPAAGDPAQPGHLPVPPDVRRTPTSPATTATTTRTTSPPPSRAATCTCSGTAR